MTATMLAWTGTDCHPPASQLLTDRATDQWVAHGTRTVTRERLLEVSRGQLEHLLNLPPSDENAVAKRAAATLNAILDAVVDGEQPTPQVFAAGDGAVTCEWLIGGSHLMVTAEADGDVYWSSDAVASLAATELQSPATDAAAEAMAREFRTRLNALAKHVARRHPVVGSRG